MMRFSEGLGQFMIGAGLIVGGVVEPEVRGASLVVGAFSILSGCLEIRFARSTAKAKQMIEDGFAALKVEATKIKARNEAYVGELVFLTKDEKPIATVPLTFAELMENLRFSAATIEPKSFDKFGLSSALDHVRRSGGSLAFNAYDYAGQADKCQQTIDACNLFSGTAGTKEVGDRK